jgi:hypothetical protein
MLEVHEESLAFGLFWLSKLTWPWAGGHGGGLREHLGRNSPKWKISGGAFCSVAAARRVLA